MTKSG